MSADDEALALRADGDEADVAADGLFDVFDVIAGGFGQILPLGAGGDAVMGARTVVEAVAIAKQVAESMDKYMKSLPADTPPAPYADIPTFQPPTSDVLGKQEVK